MKNKEFTLILALGLLLTAAASAFLLFVKPVAALVTGILGFVLTAAFLFFTMRRYRSIRALNDYLDLVCSGNYEFDIESNSEGELSILKNNLLKVITKLRTQNEAIAGDKLALADSLADISHQLKTPLTSMMVVSELLEDEKDPEKRRQFTEIINTQCERMSWLVQTLLKLSKLDAGTIELNCVPLSIKEIVDNSLEPFLITLDLKNITVKKNVPDFGFAGDKNWTVEALQNIIKNCIEHTPEGGQLEISGDENTVFKRIFIKDNGSGIAPEDLPHVFERFYHGRNSSKESVGIGLALSKAILDKENAAVSVTSEEGKGSQFEVRFYEVLV
jgi:signal transduction histidine kinase